MNLRPSFLCILPVLAIYGCSSSDSNVSLSATPGPSTSSLSGVWTSTTSVDLTSIGDEVNPIFTKQVITDSDSTVSIKTCSGSTLPETLVYDRVNDALNARTISIQGRDITPNSYQVVSSNQITSQIDSSNSLYKESNDALVDGSTVSFALENGLSVQDVKPYCIESSIAVVGGTDVYREVSMNFSENGNTYNVEITYPKTMTVGSYEVNSSSLTPTGNFVQVTVEVRDPDIEALFGSQMISPIIYSGFANSQQQIEFYQLDEQQISGEFDLEFRDDNSNILGIAVSFDLNFL